MEMDAEEEEERDDPWYELGTHALDHQPWPMPKYITYPEYYKKPGDVRRGVLQTPLESVLETAPFETCVDSNEVK